MKISADFLSQCYKELGGVSKALQYREQGLGIENHDSARKTNAKLLDMEK